MPWAQERTTTNAYADVLGTFDSAFEAGTEFGFGMWEPHGPSLVGACGLHFRQGPGVAEIGYWVRTDRHRRGYATAAVRALTTEGFRALTDIGEMHITMDKANVASAGVPARLGFLLAREEDRAIVTPGQTGRGLRWVMTRARWHRMDGEPRPAVAETG